MSNNLYISKVFIKNFRNFLAVDIKTNPKQIIFGENESGKTNYLFALQLVLDPSLSDDDRCLSESDFNTEISSPTQSKAEIIISLYFSDFEDSKAILAQMSDAFVNIDEEKFLKVTYKYFSDEREDGTMEYKYIIFKGEDETNAFTHSDRKYLQLKVIKPLRDVEYELKNTRLSPLLKLIQEYEINQEKVKRISEAMIAESHKLLEIDEINDLRKIIELRLLDVLGEESAPNIDLTMTDVESSKIFYALRLLLSGRLLEEKSLGVKNILYIILLLLQFKNQDVPSLISDREFVKYLDIDEKKILEYNYLKTAENNYKLIDDPQIELLSKFFHENSRTISPEIIIAIEEPEAHLHPIFQRLVFKNIILSNDHSVLLTTHSPNIVSVSPLEYMVHILKRKDTHSDINSCIDLDISEKEKVDIERYFDVKRGEMYFGRGVILVEGIAEEYLIRRFAELAGKSLDMYGVVVGNINSTNFSPYVQFLKKMGIPFAIVTDGDFYYEKTDGSKEYHCLKSDSDKRKNGYLGVENIKNVLKSINIDDSEDCMFGDEFRAHVKKHGIFIGNYTLEVDIMQKSASIDSALKTIVNTFNFFESKTKQEKFRSALYAGEYFTCLRIIGSKGLGKGRFAQRFSDECVEENIPLYIQEAIEYITKAVGNK